VRPRGPATPVAVVAGISLLLATLAGCGKKGPPLAPLRLVPAAVTEPTARRSGDEVELRFTLPTANANGPGEVDLARVEIYAITIAAGAVTPPNRDLLTNARVVGTRAVRPPPIEGEAGDPAKPPDNRPAPGDRVAFVDQLTADKLKPVVQKPVAPQPAGGTQTPAPQGQVPAGAGQGAVAEAPKPGAVAKPEVAGQKPEAGATKPEAAAAAPAAGPGAVPAVQPAPTAAPYPVRIYAIRGLSRSGRPGLPSARLAVPLLDPLAPPTAVAAQMPTEKAVVIDWTPPVAEPGMPPLAFNVYRREDAAAPLNPSPLRDIRFEVGGVEYGKEQCFVVRTVQAIDKVTLESVPSAPGCLTPLDKFPPAAPSGLRAVAEDGAVSLVWDRSADADLGGYLVLRGEAPGDTLQPLTPEPVKDATYRDVTVTPGVRYVYAVVAVDNATPRNSSAPSPREEVTAR
jgi:predicted small lipoprotein YifL